MLKPAKKPIQQTVILCLFTLLITFPKHGGFMLGFVFLFLAPLLLKSLYFIIKNKERKQRYIQTLLWAITCSAVIIHHVYLHETTQVFAEQVSSAIVTYHKNNGIYPETAESLGIDKQSMREFGLYYSYKDKSPFLFYRATWIIYDTYMFDFKNNKWGFQPS